MSEIQAAAYLKIHPGKLDEFMTAAEKCINTVREKDKGTLQYDWFLNADHNECHVVERYKDSDSVLEHMGNLGDTLGELLSVSDLSLNVYGNPSEQLKSALQGLDIGFFKGL